MKRHFFSRQGAGLLTYFLVLPLVAVASLVTNNSPAKLTYADLVKRLTDLEYLATLPPPGETTAQWSSYDRASKLNEKTGRFTGWDANGDSDGIIRKEGDQLVFAEMEGPGCIFRIWSAAPKTGRVRIYLDGETNAAVDLPFAEYFAGTNAPFTRPALVHTVAQGCNNYTPIPYQKSCKIVAEPGWGQYYQFVYTSFPKGTGLPTFKPELTPEDNAALDEANRLLTNCGPREFPDGHGSVSGESLFGGDDVSVTSKLQGPDAIACIRIKFDPPLTPADHDALRELILEIKWDGEFAPSVWAPLGDFFGTAPGANPYRSLPCGLTEDGWFYANWFMPFSKSAEVTIRKEGKTECRFKSEIFTERPRGNLSRYGRFHAKWHRDEFLPTQVERRIDWPLLKTKGRGRFVGGMLHVWNPRGGWWGEGDEKFFVDGEKFPSTFGTGSEDYFGYAWCNPSLFQNGFHNQTRNDGNNKGHVSVNRWHIADQIPFQKSFDGYIEKYFPNARPTLYASTVFWYLAPGGDDPYSPLPPARRTGYFVQPVTKKTPGAIEGESLKVLSQTAGQPREQDMSPFGDQWSNEAHLWWTDAKPGDKLELAFSVTNAAKYELVARLTKARDYGIVQFYFDGVKLSEPIDLFHDSVIPTGELKLGAHALSAGEHKFTVEITGANEKAVKSYMFGLDYLKLVEFK